jgi:hypothetical protein
MIGRRNFLKSAGIGAAGLALSRAGNLLASPSGASLARLRQSGMDLTALENASVLDSWGYLNVLSYRADPTGTNDSTTAIQAAIDAATSQGKGLLFPKGTFIISNTLYCDRYWPRRGGPNMPTNCHLLFGDDSDGPRPVIKLAASAPAFDNSGSPKTMIAFMHYQGDSDTNVRTTEQLRAMDPVTMPQGTTVPAGGIINATADIFDDILRDIDFDCSGHAGAVGVFYCSAQKAVMFNVKVNAVNAHTGIWGVPGRNSGIANLEVQGGRTGLRLTSAQAGSTVVGLKLEGQTEYPIVTSDFCPALIVGFEVKVNKVPFIAVSTTTSSTSTGSIALIDGIFETTASGTLITNTASKCVYARNVFVKGPASFIKSGSQPVLTGSGSCYRVVEYCSTDQYAQTAPYTSSSRKFNTFSIIDGVKNQQTPVEPVRIVENDATPPDDLISRHMYTNLPQVSFRDASKTINITQAPYNAVPDSRDNWAAIQQAIDDGNSDGRVVFVPKGVFQISKSLVLKENSKLVGIAPRRRPGTMLQFTISVLQAHSTFQKTAGNEALITTVDDPEALCYVGGLNLVSNANVLRHIHWKAGRKSSMSSMGFHEGTVTEACVYFSGNGGGRFYGVEPQTNKFSSTRNHVRMVSTTQPMSWYGCNLESGNGTNMYLLNAKNIRIYGVKREGATPTLIAENCENIALYTHGAMRQSAGTGKGGYLQIKGDSNNILIPLVLVQMIDLAPEGYNEPTLIETITGQPPVSVLYPEGVSIYKRGEIDESRMYKKNPGTLIHEVETSSINVFPNPTDGFITISGASGSIKLYDTKGNLLQSWYGAERIDISNHKPGLYFLSIEEANGRITRHKIIRK